MTSGRQQKRGRTGAPSPLLLGWPALSVLSSILIVVLEWARLPAAFLIGPMLAAIALGVSGAQLQVPPILFRAAQATVGIMIAIALSPAIIPEFIAHWPIFVGAVIVTLAASSLLGWLISRWNILPGTTAIWGSAPGAASAMVIMAGAFGADERLVAFMQYLRVIMVSVGAALIARLFIDMPASDAPGVDLFRAVEAVPFAIAAATGLAGAGLATLLRLPSPYFIGAFILGAVLTLSGTAQMQLPPALLAASFVVIGWTIGLKFDRPTVVYAVRSLPQLIVAILLLMGFCGAIAWLISHELGIDPLTAYLATSPGGMDSVAIIAAAAEGTDISFVMTMQALRFVVVLFLAAPLARFLARRVKPSHLP